MVLPSQSRERNVCVIPPVTVSNPCVHEILLFCQFFFPLELFLFAKWLKHSASSNLGSEITVLKS